MLSKYKINPELYPFESKFINIGGHEYHYIEEGNGDPVILLHGNPSWSFYYRELIKKLRPNYHCLAPDHIGMGLSDKPNDEDYNYTLEQRVNDLEVFLEAKGITKNITLIVHDWGGIIGMCFARRHSESIHKIVLLNTAGFHLPAGKSLPLMLKLSRSPLGILAIRGLNAFNGGSTRIGVKRIKMSRDVRKGYTAPYDSWKNRIGVMRFVQDIPLKKGDSGYDIISDLEENLHLLNNVPIMIAWGMKDVVFDKDILAKWIEYFPHAEVNRFEDCGHYILEDAQEEVGSLIEDFLTK